jgi:hypothetical protein
MMVWQLKGDSVAHDKQYTRKNVCGVADMYQHESGADKPTLLKVTDICTVADRRVQTGAQVLCYIFMHLSAVSTLLSTRSSRRPVHASRRHIGGGFCIE